MSMQAVLIPSVTVGGGDSMPGCFTHEGGVTITKGQLFLWEMIMTFVLVSTVYAVAVTKPGHGNIGPLAVGFSLFASAFIGEQAYNHCTASVPTTDACLRICGFWDCFGVHPRITCMSIVRIAVLLICECQTRFFGVFLLLDHACVKYGSELS